MARLPHRRQRTIRLEVTVIAIDSNFEPFTKAAFEYRQKHVYPYLENKGFKVVRCQGPLARRYYAAPAARKPNVDYLTGVGHGTYDTYTGDYYDPIFNIGNYSQEEVRGKIIHLLSCQAARSLGQDFVNQGCLAFFGYDENFIYHQEEAEVFFECDSEIDHGFADGLSAEQVYDRVIAKYDQRITEKRAAGKLYVAAMLEFDRDHLRAPSLSVMWGDPNARLDDEMKRIRNKRK
ncbi:MAG: hypothetical protein L0226_10640 [Acidobacteria bacterium]|nr:hypothetical protein [Acidobacteriota bacterium]MCI0665178.1 hypothetical protein [Acidobacteriota bacterium]